MPTPTGLPKPGETWSKTTSLPPDWKPHVTVFQVLHRGRGDYWSMRVRILSVDGKPPGQFVKNPQLWVDPAYWFSQGQLKFIK